MTSEKVVSFDWSLSLQIFLYLQLLDILTTYVGLRNGLAEASPFIQFLMRMGPIAGLLGSKIAAVGLGAYCVYRARFRVISMINYWYAGLVVWNFVLIISH